MKNLIINHTFLFQSSSTDQADYKKYPAILAVVLASVVPEQLAAWSYPRKDCDIKETSFNMVTAMLRRVHQSGNLSNLSTESFSMVQQGLSIYKSLLAPEIPSSVPFFPIGMPSVQDSLHPVALGIRNTNQDFIALWRLTGDDGVFIYGGYYRNQEMKYYV